MKQLTLREIAAWCDGTVAPEFEAITVDGISTDSREIGKGQFFIPLVGSRYDGHQYIAKAMERGAVAVMTSREIDAGIPAVRVSDTLLAFGKLAANYRQYLNIKVIAITGSVGKTTTKEMVASVMHTMYRTAKTEGNQNNDIGLPMTIMHIGQDREYAVLELGINHFGEMAYLTSIAKPDIALVTNIGTMHIEHLGSREGILKAKMEILQGLNPNGTLLLNGDEPLLWGRREALRERYKTYYFGMDNPQCDIRASKLENTDNGVSFEVEGLGQCFQVQVPAEGKHNAMNALAAVSTGLLCAIDPEHIQLGMSRFENSGMRQKIYEAEGYTIIEDCYNAGPESMRAALNVLSQHKTQGRRIAVLGDMLELGSRAMAEHYRIGRFAAGLVDMVFAYGYNATRIVTGAVTGGMDPANAMFFDSMEELVTLLKMRAEPGDVLLFKGSRGMKMEQALELFLSDIEDD